MSELPPFNSDGLLPSGDYELTLGELERSHLVVGTPGKPWAVKTREQLVRNLRIFVDHLWQIGVRDIFIDGSFECKLMDLATGDLQQRLNEHDKFRNTRRTRERAAVPGCLPPRA